MLNLGRARGGGDVWMPVDLLDVPLTLVHKTQLRREVRHLYQNVSKAASWVAIHTVHKGPVVFLC